ncbi:hypothetical protein [Arthrobacter citreus]|uniref:hypothetical protein n=1 Tax=Arthrobacter citreus TaxID=1670 RepID=UPI0031F80AAE
MHLSLNVQPAHRISTSAVQSPGVAAPPRDVARQDAAQSRVRNGWDRWSGPP